ncbi:MAG: hypothetical protein EXX96DRAFT_473398 [Benjaminiella poitrasii]|nr:MAG: hypothetical protein EXX96DRAFT_473398 [Benjaminiella poitrasii]
MNYNSKNRYNSIADKNEAKRWLVIGAYQAGATNKRIAKICGINQQSVRRIILNFKRTGSPNVPRGPTKREYDEDGNIVDSEEEEAEEAEEDTKARRPSAKDLITYVLNKAQKVEHKQEEQQQQQQQQQFIADKWRPPTPPRDPLTHASSSDKDSHCQTTPVTRTSSFSPPLSDPSSSPKQDSIRGFEAWTLEDDKILMAHVLTRLSGCRWKEAAAKLRGRHSAELCEKRWETLKDLLIRGARKSGTRGW